MTGQTSPRAARVARQEQTARELRRIAEKHGVTQAQIAAWTGQPYQHVSECFDPEADRNFTLADWRAIDHAECRIEGAAVLLGEEHIAVRRHTAGPGALTVKAAAGMLRASSIAAESLLAALEDGVVDPAERRETLRKIEAMLVDAEGMRAALLADDVPSPKRGLRVAP